MSDITEDQIQQLIRARRAMRRRALVLTPCAIAVMALLVGLGARRSATAISLGLLGLMAPVILMPYSRIISTLGLTRFEADAILNDERYQRSALAAMPPEQRAERLRTTSLAWFLAGLVSAAVFVVCVAVVIAEGGDIAVEGESSALLGTGIFLGFATFVTTPLAFLKAMQNRAGEAIVRRQIADQP